MLRLGGHDLRVSPLKISFSNIIHLNCLTVEYSTLLFIAFPFLLFYSVHRCSILLTWVRLLKSALPLGFRKASIEQFNYASWQPIFIFRFDLKAHFFYTRENIANICENQIVTIVRGVSTCDFSGFTPLVCSCH